MLALLWTRAAQLASCALKSVRALAPAIVICHRASGVAAVHTFERACHDPFTPLTSKALAAITTAAAVSDSAIRHAAVQTLLRTRRSRAARCALKPVRALAPAVLSRNRTILQTIIGTRLAWNTVSTGLSVKAKLARTATVSSGHVTNILPTIQTHYCALGSGGGSRNGSCCARS